jgi:2'-5' RNA ligase
MGNTPIDILPSLSHELHQVAHRHPIFSLELEKLGAFTSNKRPQILWCGVSESDVLMALQRDVSEVVARRGFSVTSSFKPHITLARYAKSLVNAVDDVLDAGSEKFDLQSITHFSLYESELTPQGSVYRILEDYCLLSRVSDAR